MITDDVISTPILAKNYTLLYDLHISLTKLEEIVLLSMGDLGKFVRTELYCQLGKVLDVRFVQKPVNKLLKNEGGWTTLWSLGNDFGSTELRRVPGGIVCTLVLRQSNGQFLVAYFCNPRSLEDAIDDISVRPKIAHKWVWVTKDV